MNTETQPGRETVKSCIDVFHDVATTATLLQLLLLLLRVLVVAPGSYRPGSTHYA